MLHKKKLLLLTGLMLLVGASFGFDLWQYLSLDTIKAQRENLAGFYARNTLLTIAGYFLVYVLVTALSLPAAVLLTLLGGAIFGLLAGTIIVSFASTTGATLAFLGCRYLFRESLEQRFSTQLASINRGISNNGALYLFTLRMMPAVPFFMVNLLMGLTTIKTRTFFFTSQLGMLAGTAIYVNAGTQLARLQSLNGILSPTLLGSLAALGLFPLLAKKVIGSLSLRSYPTPKRFDRNLVVIGAGAAGLVSAYIAAATKARVTLIERHKMGGDCLNTGCVPSKALIRSARLLHQIAHAAHYGIASAKADCRFGEIMARIQNVVRAIEPHDSVARYTKLGVECLQGDARISSPYTVEVNGQTLTTRSIIIATGAAPFIPPIPGLEKTGYVTSDTIWDLTELPPRLAILGGGPIGSELAQGFARLGSNVTQIEQLPRILCREDPEVSDLVGAQFAAEGLDVRCNTQVLECLARDGEKILLCECDGQREEIPFDVLLVAAGRKPRTENLGLEALGIDLTAQKTVETNDYLQTIIPTIYAAGDVAGPYQFTHVGSHQAWYAAVNALFGLFWKFRANYSAIPFATFTDPEVARVGLNETEARERGIAYAVTRYDLDDLDRAIADGEARGFVKVLTVPGKDKILGATIAGAHAGDLLIEFTLAMQHGLGLSKILSTIHIYPTMSEASRYAAGNWKRAHAPEKLLRWVEKYHHWRCR